MLLMPFWMDCYDVIAARAVGLALDRPHHLAAEEIHTKLSRILTERGFRERAGNWSARLRAAGGVARAADVLVALAAGTRAAATVGQRG
jgi:UDP:flavonoid glycosyltransferase YjiC (YdhE family)